MRLKLRLVAGALLGMATAIVLYFWVGSVLAAPAPRTVPAPPAYLETQHIQIESDSGAVLSAWWMKPENPRGVVALFHCVRCSREDMLRRAELFWNDGFAVIAPDLQAHGESTGESITFGHLEARDAVATINYVRSQEPDLPVVGLGSSLGGAALLLGSPKIRLDALILESVYPTITEAVENRIAIRLGPLAKLLTPVMLSQLEWRLGIGPDDLRPIDFIASIGCPVFIASGDRDVHTTAAETRKLFEMASEPKALWLVEGAAHQDLLRFDEQRYSENVLAFLDEHVPTD